MTDKRVIKSQAYRDTFATEAGKIVLDDIIKHSGLLDSMVSFYETNNGLAAAHANGMAELCKYILVCAGKPDTQALIDKLQTHTGTLSRS